MFTLIISQTSSKVKVIGQSSRSQKSKMLNLYFQPTIRKWGQRSGSRGQGREVTRSRSKVMRSKSKLLSQGQRSRGQGHRSGQGYKVKICFRAWLLLVTGSGRCINAGAFSCFFYFLLFRVIRIMILLNKIQKLDRKMRNIPHYLASNHAKFGILACF